jgi:hypothetical protein
MFDDMRTVRALILLRTLSLLSWFALVVTIERLNALLVGSDKCVRCLHP